MDFFARQEQARSLSRRLVLLFGLSVVAILTLVNLVVLGVLAVLERSAPGGAELQTGWLTAHPGAVVGTSLVVLGIIALASAYKTAVLRGGGGVVARALGGVRVVPGGHDPLQRRLLNVVEEMAIASGVPVPEVYLLEREAGINAFAAGHNPSNAAVAVTRGALEQLSRDELQGVIAHEFSHVLNGDMRLSIRLMGVLFGLLVIALVARTVLRHAPRSSGRDREGAAGAVMLAALAIMLLGYVGVFFGRLIQAAVSRQRESLADGSAVQFTRDPGGLRGALVKIGALGAGSKLVEADAEEVAHMLFAPGMARLFATHPPLVERIRALDPGFDPREFAAVARSLAAGVAAAAPTAAPGRPHAGVAALAPRSVAVRPEVVADLVGNPGSAHVRAAQGLRTALPEPVVAAGRDPREAAGLLFALALEPDPEVGKAQLAFVEHQLGGAIAERARSGLAAVRALEAGQRLPLLTQLFPALRQLARAERWRLLDCLRQMIRRGGSLSIFEYALGKLAQVNLRDEVEPARRPRRLPMRAAQPELQVLFSVLASHGHAAAADARRAYEAGLDRLLPRARPPYTAVPNWPAQLDRALDRLDGLAPADKEHLVEALVETIALDGRLALAEAELLRAVCAALHCPLPPLLGDETSTGA